MFLFLFFRACLFFCVDYIETIFKQIYLTLRGNPKKVLPLQIRVNLRVIALKGYSRFPELEAHHQIQFRAPPILEESILTLYRRYSLYSKPCQQSEVNNWVFINVSLVRYKVLSMAYTMRIQLLTIIIVSKIISQTITSWWSIFYDDDNWQVIALSNWLYWWTFF